jgi:hypothetical protein
MKQQINEIKRMQELAGVTEAEENFLVKGDDQVIIRIEDALQQIQDAMEQLMQDPTKNVRGLAKYAMDSLNDVREILNK